MANRYLGVGKAALVEASRTRTFCIFKLSIINFFNTNYVKILNKIFSKEYRIKIYSYIAIKNRLKDIFFRFKLRFLNNLTN